MNGRELWFKLDLLPLEKCLHGMVCGYLETQHSILSLFFKSESQERNKIYFIRNHDSLGHKF